MTLRYFTDQVMTQKIQNTDRDIKLITQHLNTQCFKKAPVKGIDY